MSKLRGRGEGDSPHPGWQESGRPNLASTPVLLSTDLAQGTLCGDRVTAPPAGPAEAGFWGGGLQAARKLVPLSL